MMQEPYTPVRPDYAEYTCHDYEATETEVLYFIGGLVRALKPRTVVEVGTHKGYGSRAIGEALAANGKGTLHTYETNADKRDEAILRCSSLPVICVHGDGNALQWNGFHPVDILFIDGELDNREESWDVWVPRLADEAFILVHDSRKYPEVEEFVDSAGYDFNYVNLPTPRGLAIIQKRP